MAAISSAASGNWSAGATWAGGVPTSADTVTIAKRRVTEPMFTPEIVGELIRAYVNGGSPRVIADQFGCSVAYIMKAAKKHGVSRSLKEAARIREINNPNRRVKHSEALKDRKQYWSESPAFKGGTASSWKMNVLRRDGFKCQDCGIVDVVVLAAHHIKPQKTHPELAMDLDNGVTLCHNCHARRHFVAGSKYGGNHVKRVIL